MAFYLVGRPTPSPIARTCLEERGAVQDCRDGAILLRGWLNAKWIKVDSDEKGHFVFDLLGGLPAKGE